MPPSPAAHAAPALPRLPAAILRALLPPAERDELLADLAHEYAALAASGGRRAARRWLWRQALGSAPALLGWTWWRGWTGWTPRANSYRPGGPMLKNWITDARYAARRLRARPAYTLIAILTLALGIGGTAAVFGIARPLVFDPLPYANTKEVAYFWMGGSWNEEEFTHLRGNFPGFRAVAFYRDNDVTMRDGDAPARLLPGVATSWELFDVLGARPVIGRGFQPGDDAPGAEPVAVLSYGLWQELGGAPSILGTRVTLDGAPRTVVGVMPRRFWYPTPDVRIWVPQEINPTRRNGSYTLVGRVNPGQDPAHMDAQVAQLTRALGERFKYPEKWDKTKNASVKPLREALLGSMRPAIVATFVAMALILLIACVNVAALMLGQVEGRSVELAVRSALGASRGRITQQLVIEALVLGAGAGLAGAGLAAGGFRLLARALPLGTFGDHSSFDWTMFAAAMAIAVLAVLLVVLVPAVSLWRGSLRDTMGLARTGGIQGRGGRLEQGLVVAEVALAMLIACGAALLVRSVRNLYAIDPGVDTRGVAVIDVVTRRDMTSRDRRLTVDRVLGALADLPAAKSVAAAMKIPLRGGGDSFDFNIPGKPELGQQSTYFRVVSPDYFATMGIRLREGRLFTSGDVTNPEDTTAMAVVVNEALVRKYFPGEHPVGRLIGGGWAPPQRIVGVVNDVAEGALTDEREPVRYYVAGQAPFFGTRVAIVVRTKRPQDAVALLDDARRTVQKTAPELAVQEATTMQRVFDAAVGPARQLMALLSLLSALALVLGAVGIYGVISHFAARRKRDWAIRVALGLPGSRVVTHIVGQGAALVGIGIAFGVVGTIALARLLTTFLFGVGAVDPLAFGAASAVLLAVGLVAAFVPARRAGTVDPALVLREQ